MKINKLPIVAFCLVGICAFAQNQQLEEKLMSLKQNQAANKTKAGAVHVDGDRNHQNQG
jgi:hypothetical protein